MGKIGLLSLSYKTTVIEMREKLAVPQDQFLPLISALTKTRVSSEIMVLSTCNRVEIYFVSENPLKSFEKLKSAFLHFLNLEKELNIAFQEMYGAHAVKHLYRVASSLESLVIGEPQILGQIKDAYKISQMAGGCGILLNKLFNNAFTVAKRVRFETEIARFAVSISYAAVELAKKIFSDLNEKTILIIGAGEMAELAVAHLIKAGICRVMVTNRTFKKAVHLAEKFEGSAVRMEAIAEHLENADIIISSTGAKKYIIEPEMVRNSMKKRKQKPAFFIDIAVPRDIDPNVNEINNVFVYNIDDLQNVVDSNLNEREKEAEKAKDLIEEEVKNYFRWISSLEVVPIIKAFRSQIRKLVQTELEATFTRMKNLDMEQKSEIKKIARSITNKFLHQPTVQLRELSKNKQLIAVDSFQEIFQLNVQEKQKKSDKIIPMKNEILIGTRSSQLALWQAEWIKSLILENFPELNIRLIHIKTIGDNILDTPLSKVGGKGLFVKELEQALLKKEIDLAVHSMKDVPTELPPGLEISVITKRNDPTDAFVSNKYESFFSLPEHAVVGTSSLRRIAQLKHVRKDLDFLSVRGNLNTRLAKLDSGKFDALILATAGLNRLEMSERIQEKLPIDLSIPAISQGAIGIEIREKDLNTYNLIKDLHHPDTEKCVGIERQFLKRCNGGCQVPVAGYAVLLKNMIHFSAAIGDPEGRILLKSSTKSPINEFKDMGKKVAEDLLKKGADKILKSVGIEVYLEMALLHKEILE